MKNLCDPDIARHRIRHPVHIPDEIRPWAGAFEIMRNGTWLRVIASRGGSPYDDERDGGADWDHLSVSTPDRCPTWEEMEFVKRLFFKRDECAMQLHVPPAEHINNHEYCLHIWRPLNAAIPRPSSIMVGIQGLKVA